jgi:long-chain acyl-CoA synthetase
MDKSKRIQRPVYPLETVPTLKGKQLHFDSVAEMITVRAREIPDEPYVYFYEEVVTYAQTNERANRVANYLKDKGVKKGDIVSVMILNSPEVYYPMFGAQKLGAIAGTINYMLKGPEISHVLNDSKPKVVFVGSQFMYDFAIGYEMAEHKPIVIEVNTGVDHDTNIVEQWHGRHKWCR